MGVGDGDSEYGFSADGVSFAELGAGGGVEEGADLVLPLGELRRVRTWCCHWVRLVQMGVLACWPSLMGRAQELPRWLLVALSVSMRATFSVA
ncbi:hypothetical protein EEB13_31055 [Rhodococcus sp. WS3]|nr:hypothetical protein EEB13_31055 [Rhodococcus sp. WS3]